MQSDSTERHPHTICNKRVACVALRDTSDQGKHVGFRVQGQFQLRWLDLPCFAGIFSELYLLLPFPGQRRAKAREIDSDRLLSCQNNDGALFAGESVRPPIISERICGRWRQLGLKGQTERILNIGGLTVQRIHFKWEYQFREAISLLANLVRSLS